MTERQQSPSDRRVDSVRFALDLPPHPLMAEGYSFRRDMLLVTPWGQPLPSVSFSEEMFRRFIGSAGNPSVFHSEDVVLFAQYLEERLIFNPVMGCWDLPLKADFDNKRRARYPLVTNKRLGLSSELAHRATLSILRDVEVKDMHVDHLCRRHACCNPYHLEATDHATNTRRGAEDRRRMTQPDLFQLAPGIVACARVMSEYSRI